LLLLLGRSSRRILVAGVDAAAQLRQHVLACLCVGTVRRQRQILLESFHGSGRKYELAVLIDRGLGREAQTILIVGVGILGIVGSHIDRRFESLGGRFRLSVI